jgi:hypothetical protein|nr:hypothetical protein [uncultured Steroidobacter sp.]
MSDHVKATIKDLQNELKKQEAAVVEKKKLINMLCAHAGMPPMYSDVELQASSGPSLSIKSDQFYGQSMITAMRQILEMRKSLDQGPATINEIHAALVEGNFIFETKDEANAKRGIRISVTKNSGIFHKLPNGRVGLLEWYPNVKAPKAKKTASDNGADNDDADSDDNAVEDVVGETEEDQ